MKNISYKKFQSIDFPIDHGIKDIIDVLYYNAQNFENVVQKTDMQALKTFIFDFKQKIVISTFSFLN